MDGTETKAQREWGFFDRPLFTGANARGLDRVGVVDIGSNSVRMVVFDGAARSPAYFFNEKIMCALGDGLSETGRLNPTGRTRAMRAIHRFQKLAHSMGAAPLTAVATAAVREATDGPEFCEEVRRETGLSIHVIDGREEARLSAQGVLLGWPNAEGMICDIGGSSMELAEISAGQVGARLTSALGPLKLKGMKGGKKAIKAHVREIIEGLAQELPPKGGRLFLVGGSWRAVARINMARTNYPLTVLHEYRMDRKSVLATSEWIKTQVPGELRAQTGTSSNRMALVPDALIVLKELLRVYKPRDIAVSSYGIREGMLFEQMPPDLRERDPLLEAARFAESKDARIPGFGKQLFQFIHPLFTGVHPDRLRLIKAACLMHDVTWRAHPDYRAEVCFDNATRANLGGLRHRERVFLGLALLHRYKNSRDNSRHTEVFKLLDQKALNDAEVLGKALRFGAMFSVDRLNDIAHLKYHPRKKELKLFLTPAAEPLFGEVVEARLKALGTALGAEVTVKRTG